MDLQFVTAPLIGAVIGYITNYIAIKMLFRPRKAIYIKKWKLPFTPGLIPKEKDRVAKSIGNAVSTQLLNSDTIKETLLSEEMTGKIRATLENIVEQNYNNEDTIEDILLKFIEKDNFDKFATGLKESISKTLYKKLTASETEEKLSMFVLRAIRQKVDSSKLSMFINDGLVNGLSKNVSEQVNGMIISNAEDMIKSIINSESDKLLTIRINDIIGKHEEKIIKIVDLILYMYNNIIENNLDKILNTINISKIIEEKISSFEVAELENLIFGIMKKELNAIVYLGALLGFIMGFVNLFFSL